MRTGGIRRFSLRLAFSSAAPLDGEDAAFFREQTGLAINEIYGSTETGGMAIRSYGENHGSWEPFACIDWKILSDHLCVRSAFISPDLPRDAEGFFMTADRAAEAGEARFMLRGRADHVVKIAGKRVDLEEIREKIRRIPGVTDAYVTAVPLKRARQDGDRGPGGERSARPRSPGGHPVDGRILRPAEEDPDRRGDPDPAEREDRPGAGRPAPLRLAGRERSGGLRCELAADGDGSYCWAWYRWSRFSHCRKSPPVRKSPSGNWARDWRFSSCPTYPGSDQNRIYLLPYPYFIYRGDILTGRSGSGLGTHLQDRYRSVGLQPLRPGPRQELGQRRPQRHARSGSDVRSRTFLEHDASGEPAGSV